MYKCRDCKEYFEEPRRYTDWVEFWGSNVPMESYTCPYCGGEDFDDVDEVEAEELEEEEQEEEDD